MDDLLEQKSQLLGSFLLFTQVFYKLRTGRDFELSQPIGRESHYITVARELTKCQRLETQRLIINIPPGHGKSELLIHFVAWCLAQYPDSNFLYISYSHNLAARHTHTIKTIIEMPIYKKLFGVELRKDSSAKDNFKTVQGGCVRAYGSAGAITGQDAGLPISDRFSGCVIMDDMHKPDEVFSETIRQTVIDNYNRTIKPRPRSPVVPLIFLGQRLLEEDLAGWLINGNDGCAWKQLVLPAIDLANNVLDPAKTPREMLEREEQFNRFVFYSQYQQQPIPAGGSLFNRNDFVLLDDLPEIIATFITVDTAETDKDYNDATVFSFWGIYRIEQAGVETDLLGLHWIDCLELRIEPKDLEANFMQFYADCMRFKVKPHKIAIEKKSTGVTLSSVLKNVRGLQVIEINRTKASGSKTARYVEMQPYIAAKRISLITDANHAEICINHMSKITANNAHRHDDICDTAYDAVKLGLIDQSIYFVSPQNQQKEEILKSFKDHYKQAEMARSH